MMQLRNRLKKVTPYWGEGFGGLAILLSLVRVATEYPPGHYLTFTQAAHALWMGEPSYGVRFAGNYYFLSPACSLFFYGPFSWLPVMPGVFLYTVFSAALFWYGANRFGRMVLSPSARQWFWFLLGSHFYSALAAHKPEVSSLGVLFLCAAWLVEGRHTGWAAFGLAMIGNFKFQPFPSIGLMALVWMVFRPQPWRWLLGLWASTAFWFGVPALIRPWGYLQEQQAIWFSTLRDFSAEVFDFFDNVFAFVLNNFGWKMSYETSQWISMGLGLLCAGVVLSACLSIYRGDSAQGFLRGIFLALVLGCSYTVLVSPLQQINAYILLAPLFMALAAARESNPRVWTPFVLGLFVFWSILYSGLIPADLREVFRHSVLRVPATVAALLATTFWLLRRQPALR